MPWIALLALSVSIELVSSSARVTSVKSYKRQFVCDGQTSGPIDRTPGLPGSDKNAAVYKYVCDCSRASACLAAEELGAAAAHR